MTTEELQQKHDKVDQALALLRDHFDAVQVLATFQQEGDTFAVCKGFGNWYSRYGMAKEMLDKDVAQENATQIANRLKEGDDE